MSGMVARQSYHAGMTELRRALRALARSPGFTAVAVLSLALGIGATTTIFSVVYGVLQRPLPYRDPASLVLVDGTRRFAGEARPQSFSGPDLPALQAARSLSSLAGYAETGQALDARDVVEPITGVLVSETFFTTLGAAPAAGRFLGSGDDKATVAVISHRLWQRLFDGRADAVGATLTLGDRPYAVVGVAASDFRFPSERVDVWTPMGEAVDSGLAPWLTFERGGGVSVVARLQPRATIAQAHAELELIGRQRAIEPVLTSLAEAASAGLGPALRLLFAAVFLMLLVAAANVANLMLARYTARERDIAVRRALGASRQRIVGHVLAEGVVLGAAGGLAGVLLAFGLVRGLVWSGPTQLPRLEAIRVDGPVLAFAVGVGLMATVLSSLLPALHSARQDTALGASSRIARPARAGRLRALLVASELAVSVVLLVGTSVLTRSLVRLLEVDIGARTDHVLAARLDLSLGRTLDEAQQRALGQALVERSRALPGATHVALGTALPPNGRMVQLTLKDVTTASTAVAEYAAIAAPTSPGFFEALDIPLLEGRLFDDRDDASRGRVLIVSADVARDLFGGHALGQTLSLPTPRQGNVTATVVGVVGNVRYRGLARPAEPTLYVPFAQQPWSTAFVVVRTEGNPAAMAGHLREVLGSVDRRIGVVNIRPLSEILSLETAQPAFRAALLWAITGTAVLLAAIGLAGVVGYSVARRTGEIGVRMALGAAPGDVARMVVIETLRIGMTGGVVGLLAAAATTRVLSGFVFGVRPDDPASFAAAGAFFVLVIVAAGLRPAWRAAHVDPVEALRAE